MKVSAYKIIRAGSTPGALEAEVATAIEKGFNIMIGQPFIWRDWFCQAVAKED